MKKINPFRIWLLAILFLFTTTAALAQEDSALQNQRIDVIKQYVKLLGQGNYATIPQLFTKDALTISSTGALDNPTHFYKILFTKTISNPKSSFMNVFEGKIDTNMLIGYFNLSWNNTHGKNVSAKFLDLFVFQAGTAKIKNLFIFSNIFKEEIMKQL